LAVTVNTAVPSQPSAITGSATVCSGSSQSYSVSGVDGVTYNWSLPNGWNKTAGGTTNSITVTAGSTGGNITVTPSNSCGNGTARTLAVTVNTAVPSQPSTITGNATVCSGATSQTYSVTNVSGVTYNWTLPNGWTKTAGGTTNSITVTAGSTAGNITVTPSNGCGNGTARTLAVTVSAACSGYCVMKGAYSAPTGYQTLAGSGTTMTQIPGYGFAASGNLCLAPADQSSASTYTWTEAASECASKTTDGNSWRLPNIAELGNLQDKRRSYGMDGIIYWSGTEYSVENAWSWYYTYVYTMSDRRTDKRSVRCVRSL
jgi:hypothetical protein